MLCAMSSGPFGEWCSVWTAGVSEIGSSGPPCRAIATVQALNSGIRDCGSRAGLVSRFASESPPQWKGAKTVSGRIASVSRARKTARAAAGLEPDQVAGADAVPAGEVRVQLGDRVRHGEQQRLGPAGLGAGLVVLHQPAGGQVVRVVGVGLLGGAAVLDRDEAAPARPAVAKRSANRRGVPG